MASAEAMRIVDAHTHAFRDAAMAKLWLGPDGKRTGDLGELRALLDEAGIDKAVVLLFHRSAELYEEELKAGSAPDVAREMIRAAIRSYNRWGCEAAANEPRFLPFIGVNPRFMSPDEVDAEIRWGKAMGAVGVKIIPNRLKAYANDPLLTPVFRSCTDMGMPLLSQSGSYGMVPSSQGDPFGHPKYFQDVLEQFPQLHLILAHMGHGYEKDVANLTRQFPNVFTDTSLRLSRLGSSGNWSASEVVDAIRSIGVDRVLFGSNYPFVNPVGYVKTLESLPLTDGERRQIASGNFERLMST